MFESTTLAGSKPQQYAQLAAQARSLLHGEHDRIANAANFAALVWHALPDLNWCGFYFFDGSELVVGPFQGKPACARIPFGRGVCGTTAALRKTIVVPDVHAFPGHIACDSRSNSEIVVPVLDKAGDLIAVLDVDSTDFAAFDETDARGLEAICKAMLS